MAVHSKREPLVFTDLAEKGLQLIPDVVSSVAVGSDPYVDYGLGV
jgi:hypothetical protein